MSIRYVILGYLSWRPLSGYDLKKLIADSVAFYWSGNNNQIYTTLVELHRGGAVTNEVQPQEHLPARKVYSITEQGRAELQVWLRTPPEQPQVRSQFLAQLAWADLLTSAELDTLLAQYESEAEMQVLMCREQERRGDVRPARSLREVYLWKMIAQNRIDFHQHELAWVRRMRSELTSEAAT